MIPIPLTWADFADGEVKEVVVEHLYCGRPGAPYLTALIPADVYRKDGYMVVEYSRFLDYCRPARTRNLYSESCYPVMHRKGSLRFEVQLSIAVGNLVLWDKNSDQLVRSDLCWWDLLKDKPWFEWSAEDQDYTKPCV